MRRAQAMCMARCAEARIAFAAQWAFGRWRHAAALCGAMEAQLEGMRRIASVAGGMEGSPRSANAHSASSRRRQSRLVSPLRPTAAARLTTPSGTHPASPMGGGDAPATADASAADAGAADASAADASAEYEAELEQYELWIVTATLRRAIASSEGHAATLRLSHALRRWQLAVLALEATSAAAAAAAAAAARRPAPSSKP